MRPITPATERQIVLLWMHGYTYEEIAGKAGVGTGTVSNVIQDFRAGGKPEFESLREAAEEVREALRQARERGLGAADLVYGATFLLQAIEAGIPVPDVGKLLVLVTDLPGAETEDREAFFAAAAELSGERKRTGRPWHDVRRQIEEDRRAAEEAVTLRAKLEAEAKQAAANRDKSLAEARAAEEEASSWESRAKEVHALEGQVAELRGELGALRRELKTVAAQIQDSQNQLVGKRRELDGVQRAVKEARHREEEVRTRLGETLECEADLKKIQDGLGDWERRRAELKTVCEEEQRHLDDLRLRLRALAGFEVEAADLSKARQQLLEDIRLLEKRKNQVRAEIEEMEREAERLRDAVNATQYFFQYLTSPSSRLPTDFWEAMEHLVDIKLGRKPHFRSLEPRLEQIAITGLKASLIWLMRGKVVDAGEYEKLRLKAESLEKKVTFSVPKDRYLIVQKENEAIQDENGRLKADVTAAKEKAAAIDDVFTVTNPCMCGETMTYALADGVTYTRMLNSGAKFQATCAKCGRTTPLTAAQFCLRVGHTLLTRLRGD